MLNTVGSLEVLSRMLHPGGLVLAHADARMPRGLSGALAAQGEPVLGSPVLVTGSGAPQLWLPTDQAARAERIAARRKDLASLAHALAHLRHGDAPQSPTGLKPLQRALMGVFEDARVEALACEELPGLRPLWAAHFVEDRPPLLDAAGLLAQLAHALFHAAQAAPHPWVHKARVAHGQVLAASRAAPERQARLRDLASRLGHELGQTRLGFQASAYRPWPSYRDDNRHMWPLDAAADPQGRREVGRIPQAEPEVPSSPSAVEPSLQWEWDHLIGRHRAAWCTVWCEPEPVNVVGPAVTSRRAPRARRRVLWGELLDLDALVDLGLMRRLGRPADEAVFLESEPRGRPLRVELLLDQSLSTGDAMPFAMGGEPGTLTVLDALRLWAQRLISGLEAQGDHCVLHAFHSDTRHQVRLQRIKSAGQRLQDPGVRHSLQALKPAGSTRMGAVVRQRLAVLGAQSLPGVIVLLGDGEPHDIDVHDPRYLRADLAEAIREAAAMGVAVRVLQVGGLAVTSPLSFDGGGRAPPPAVMRLDRATDLSRVLAWLRGGR